MSGSADSRGHSACMAPWVTAMPLACGTCRQSKMLRPGLSGSRGKPWRGICWSWRRRGLPSHLTHPFRHVQNPSLVPQVAAIKPNVTHLNYRSRCHHLGLFAPPPPTPVSSQGCRRVLSSSAPQFCGFPPAKASPHQGLQLPCSLLSALRPTSPLALL